MSSPRAAATTPPDDQCPHAQLMDRMYALQRYVYDFTRKYYLFGRDRLIARMPIEPSDRVLEIGCGTGRNLILLARKHPAARFYGIDAANVMIQTAMLKVAGNRLTERIHLRQGMAQSLDAHSWFDLPAFERILFSYSLSMIPTWPEAIEAAMANLAPRGEMWVVDFWDQAGYPAILSALLKRWLSMFHVHHRPELLTYLHQMQADHRGALTLVPIGARYAYLARFVKSA